VCGNEKPLIANPEQVGGGFCIFLYVRSELVIGWAQEAGEVFLLFDPAIQHVILTSYLWTFRQIPAGMFRFPYLGRRTKPKRKVKRQIKVLALPRTFLTTLKHTEKLEIIKMSGFGIQYK
jgi:hypothetical protein